MDRSELNRRRLLTALGAGVTASLIGCVSNTALDEPEPDTATNPTVNTPEPEQIENNKTVTIGTSSDLNKSDLNESEVGYHSQSVRVKNLGSSERNISLTLSNITSEKPVFDQTYTFAPNATLKITIYKPGNYSGVVRTNGNRDTFDLPPFDCNEVGVGIEVAENGNIDSGISSTLLGCPSLSETYETTTDQQ